MILETDSPLRRIPAQLNPRQILFFDGIRYSIDMVDMAHQRLVGTLYDLTKNCTSHSDEPIATKFITATQDAWSIIDSVHRLRMLIGQSPGFKQNTPDYQLFFRGTAKITDLRNFIQHLDQNIPKLESQNIPVWGALSWITVLDPNCKSCFTCTLLTGTIFKSMEELLVNPIGKKIEIPIDHITLAANGYTISLSDVMRSIQRITRYVESGLKDQIKDLPPKQEDILACAEIEFGNTN
jgi:hypothetical protein